MVIAATVVALVLELSLLPVAPADGSIYWSDLGVARVRKPMISCANLDGSGVTHSFIQVVATDFAVDADHLYWTDWDGRQIGRANLDGSAVNPNLVTGLPKWVGGIAVDDAHLYWTAWELGVIGRANLDGTGVDPSWITGLNQPFGIAADGQHVYWTEFADPLATIGRATVGGAEVDRGFIALDWMAERLALGGGYLFWASGAIGRAALDGSGVTAGFVGGFNGEVTDVAVAGDHVYWATNDVDLGRADLGGANVERSFITSDQSLKSLAVAPSPGCPASGPGRATAKRTQTQKGEKIRVEVSVSATDRLTADVRGRVKLGPAYALEPVSKRVDTGETKAMTLKLKRRRAQERIAAALKRGEKARAKLTVKLSDYADNAEVEKLRVKLKDS